MSSMTILNFYGGCFNEQSDESCGLGGDNTICSDSGLPFIGGNHLSAPDQELPYYLLGCDYCHLLCDLRQEKEN